MLIENIIQGNHWNFAVVGIGININQVVFDPLIPNPVSLRQIRGQVQDPVELAGELLLDIDRYWALWKNGGTDIMQMFNDVLYRRGEMAKFKSENRIFEGRVKLVKGSGELVVETAIEETFSVGQLTWL
jgi:BirA family biotin operon repressor/biotin-[acetyl-CoA-carboxylase] ligase